MTVSVRSARKALRALVADAVEREADLPEGAARRIADRLMRRSADLAEICASLKAGAAPAPVPVSAVADPASSFDPYAIGAVVTLQRHGPDGLLSRLSAITRVEDLVTLAAAQNLSLKAGWASADELRTAIVACAAQRLDERRAAAS
jgi:hypothetical protein